MKITIINAKTDLGVTISGTDLGPSILSNNFKNDKRINKIIDIEKDNINKSYDKADLAKNLDSINKFNEKLYNTVLSEKENESFPITLGGDHSIAIATALASIKKEENLGIIWIDSHGDYNTFETTKTGNIHGLPLSTINNQTGEKLTHFHTGNFYLPENTVIIGGRDIDPWEMPVIKENNVTLFTTEDVKKEGLKTIIEKAIKIASNNTKGIHISYDTDVIDPSIAPGVSIPADNGLNEKEALEITEELLKHKDKIKSFDLVEFNPTNDIDKKTETLATNILEIIINNI